MWDPDTDDEPELYDPDVIEVEVTVRGRGGSTRLSLSWHEEKDDEFLAEAFASIGGTVVALSRGMGLRGEPDGPEHGVGDGSDSGGAVRSVGQ